MFTSTLQGFSGTQGNPVIFTVNTFAVHFKMIKRHFANLRRVWEGQVIWSNMTTTQFYLSYRLFINDLFQKDGIDLK